MADDPPWLTVENVRDIHHDQLRRFGGAAGLKSLALLESAVAAPLNLLVYGSTDDTLRLAAQLAHAIVRNHPFVDGNKRTATVALLEFLHLNGVTIDLPDSESEQPLAELVERLAAGDVTAQQLSDLLRPYLVRV